MNTERPPTSLLISPQFIKPPHPPIQPTVIAKEAHTFDGGKPFRMFYSSLAGSDTFRDPMARRVALQGMFWTLGQEKNIPANGLDVKIIGPYQTSNEHQFKIGRPSSRIDPHVDSIQHHQTTATESNQENESDQNHDPLSAFWSWIGLSPNSTSDMGSGRAGFSVYANDKTLNRRTICGRAFSV
jgi:hypothetical protein